MKYLKGDVVKFIVRERDKFIKTDDDLSLKEAMNSIICGSFPDYIKRFASGVKHTYVKIENL